VVQIDKKAARPLPGFFTAGRADFLCLSNEMIRRDPLKHGDGGSIGAAFLVSQSTISRAK